MPLTDTASSATRERFKGTSLWKPWMEQIRLRQAGSLAHVQEFLEKGADKPRISWDLETETLDPYPQNVVGHCVAFDGTEAMYIPTRHQTNATVNLDHDKVWEMILAAIVEPKILEVFNWKFEGLCLRRMGVKRLSDHRHLRDGLIYTYLGDANSKKLNLKDSATRYLGHEMIEIHEVPGIKLDTKKKGRLNFALADPEEATLYAAADPVMTHLVIEKLEPEVLEEQKFICVLEHSVLEAALAMEDNPVTIDRAFLKRGKEDLERWKDVLSREIYEIAGTSFNIGSPVEVGNFLHDQGVPLEKTQKSGQWATSDKAIGKLAYEHPIVGKLLLWRSLDKEKGSYVEPLLRDTSDENPRATFKFKSVGAPTGRWAGGGKDSGEHHYAGVNVQSIPNANAYKRVPCWICENTPVDVLNGALALGGGEGDSLEALYEDHEELEDEHEEGLDG